MRTTTIQLDELTDKRITELIELGYGKTVIAVLRRAVEHEWVNYRRYLDNQPPPPPKKERA